jgi:hypothetical protein
MFLSSSFCADRKRALAKKPARINSFFISIY